MEINNKQNNFKVHDVESNPGGELSAHKRNRKLFIVILFMFLITSQIVLLLANSGFINRAPEPIVNEPPVSLDQIKKVETDLKKVIKTLNSINGDTDEKEKHVKVKKVEVKPIKVLLLPVEVQKKVKVVKQGKKVKKPKQKIIESKQAVVIEKNPVIVVPEPVVDNAETTKLLNKFVYIKHDVDGKVLDDNDEQWVCVQDKKNGLMWEVKSKEDTLRNPDNLYSWFNPQNNTQIKGVTDGGRCKGDTDCDTNAYVKAMNQRNFCGHNDWRLPTREEMMGLVNFTGANIKIDTNYFPETLPSWYWTASSNESRPEFAWYVLFKNGMSLNDLKENPKHIRLVRSRKSLASN